MSDPMTSQGTPSALSVLSNQKYSSLDYNKHDHCARAIFPLLLHHIPHVGFFCLLQTVSL